MVAQLDGSDPLVFLGALALLIGLGFLGNLIFSKLRFNDTLILIFVGVLVGPITGAIAPESLAGVSSIVGPLALILILFDGGLALKINDLLHGLGSAAIMGFLGFVATLGLVGAITAVSLDVPLMTGMVLGAILGGTSALAVLPALGHMSVKKKTATTLGLESALTDVLVVVVSFTLISIAAVSAASTGAATNSTAAGFDAQGITSTLLITFAMSIFLGVAAGFTWLFAYPKLSDKPFGYMLTLGCMFFLYVVVEWLLRDISSGGGPLAVLAFGVVLGNYEGFGKRFLQSIGEGFGAGMKRFQGEIAFLVRTFFFVYLGILVDLEILADVKVLGIGLVIFAGLMAARYLAVMATTRSIKLEGDSMVLWIMAPRGLAAAVLAAEPASRGIEGTESFVALAFLILVLTNLVATVGPLMIEARAKKGRRPGSKHATTKSGGAKAPARKAKAPARKTTPARTTTKSRATTRTFKVSGTTESSLEKFGGKKRRS